MFIRWIKIFFSSMHFALREVFACRKFISRVYLYCFQTKRGVRIWRLESTLLNQISLLIDSNVLSLSLSISLCTQEPPVQVNLFKCRSIQKDDTHRHGGSSTSASLFSLLCHPRYDPFVSPPQKGRPEQWCTIREFVYKWRSASSFEDICWWNPSNGEDFSWRGIKNRIHTWIFDKWNKRKSNSYVFSISKRNTIIKQRKRRKSKLIVHASLDNICWMKSVYKRKRTAPKIELIKYEFLISKRNNYKTE